MVVILDFCVELGEKVHDDIHELFKQFKPEWSQEKLKIEVFRIFIIFNFLINFYEHRLE